MFLLLEFLGFYFFSFQYIYIFKSEYPLFKGGGSVFYNCFYFIYLLFIALFVVVFLELYFWRSVF